MHVIQTRLVLNCKSLECTNVCDVYVQTDAPLGDVCMTSQTPRV